MKHTAHRVGLTLLESVVVLGISVLAVSLMMPLLSSARSQSRRAGCVNNLRRIGGGVVQHEQSLGFYPSSGWSPGIYTGEPDLGFGKEQPGGWLWDVLAFTSFADIRMHGSDLRGEAREAARLRAHQTPIPIINCPARRPPRTYPMTRINTPASNLFCSSPCSVVRTDYRGNSGNVSMGDQPTETNGVTHVRSEVRAAQIVDGVSHTMAVADKYLNADHYYTGSSANDHRTAYINANRNVNGYTASSDTRGNPVRFFLPHRDRQGVELTWTFGSAHPGGLNAAFCDTSVRTISYDINHRVFWALGGRDDGEIAPF